MIKYSIVILLLIGLFACGPKNQLTIVKNGNTDYEIVLPENADNLVKKAAKELQTYLKKITSADLPIVFHFATDPNKKKIILLNELDNTSSPHSINIKIEKNQLIIAGGNSKSVLYAVYEFLEKYTDCRWYSPKVELIPSLKTISLPTPLNYSYTPEITTRTMHSRLFYNNHTFADKLRVTHEAFPGYVPSARVHTFHRFVPEKTFYNKHPEYYALRGNKRLHTQLCLTNKDVLKIVSDSVQAYFKRFPDANVISVSQDDNTQHCQCASCTKIDKEEGSASGSMIHFVNAVAKQFPDKQISTLAYQYTRKAPKTKPLENVLITLCSIECDRSASITDNCSDFAEDLMGWKEVTKNIRIWDYTTQFTNFLAPFPNIHTLQPNLQFFRDNNAKWVFEQHSNNPSELFELRSYLTAKLLWNPDLDSNELINDFLTGYYEEAGSYVKKYIDLVHDEINKDSDYFLFLYGDPAQAFNSFLKPELLTQYNDFFNEAEKAIADKEEILRRVRAARLSTDYAMLEMARNGMSPNFQLLNNGSISNDVSMRIKRFKETCKNSNITLMNEMGYSVDEYLSLYEESLSRAAMPNLAKGKSVKLNTKPKKYANENPQALTDAALGGSNFYANWLGFEGNNLEAVIDLGKEVEIKNISTGFLQVTNHIVFFPESVTYSYSNDGKSFTNLKKVNCAKPLSKESKKNDIEYFTSTFEPIKVRFVKITAKNISKAPVWHNAAGLPSWIFADEVIVN